MYSYVFNVIILCMSYTVYTVFHCILVITLHSVYLKVERRQRLPAPGEVPLLREAPRRAGPGVLPRVLHHLQPRQRDQAQVRGQWGGRPAVQVTETARACSYYSSKQVQKIGCRHMDGRYNTHNTVQNMLLLAVITVNVLAGTRATAPSSFG